MPDEFCLHKDDCQEKLVFLEQIGTLTRSTSVFFVPTKYSSYYIKVAATQRK